MLSDQYSLVWIEIIHVSASVVFIDSYTAFHFSDCCSEKCPEAETVFFQQLDKIIQAATTEKKEERLLHG